LRIFTVTIGICKAGLIADDALNYVGRLEVVPLHEACMARIKRLKKSSQVRLLFAGCSRDGNTARTKTNFGRIGVVAGSKGIYYRRWP